MDLTQIRYFLALSQTLNFTRAAEQCHVTQPALTKSIQRLEAELGGPLLLRERALTQLTALGQSMLPLLEQAHAAAERAKAHASGLRRRQESPLRAGIATDLVATPFVPLFAELAARLPGFVLTVASGTSAVLSEALLQGTLDVALMASPPDLPERMNRWSLFEEPAFLSMRADHPAATAYAPTVEALHGQAVVLHRHGCPLTRLLDAAPHVQPSVRHWVETAEHMTALVQAGLGVASLPLASEAAPGLVRREIAGAPASAAVLVVVAGRPATHAADLFVKMARARDWRGVVTAR